LGIVLALFLLFGALVVVVGVLAVTGDPGECTPGGTAPISNDAQHSASFQQKLDALNATLDGGAPGSTTFDESELTSRANTYADEHDIPFDNINVCVHDGDGEGSAAFSFLGMDVKIKVRGTVDLSGDHPDAHVDDMEIGNVPDFLTGPIESAANSAIDDAFNDVNLEHSYTPVLTPGQAQLDGTP
jgi:hypothetical protein